jgi:AbrB family looped-hinge helix DNA binding protein
MTMILLSVGSRTVSKDTEQSLNARITVSENRFFGQKFFQRSGLSGTSKVGKRGAVVIPVELRRRFGIEEGSLVIAEATEEGVLLRPAVAVPVENYSPERQAEFILSNAVGQRDYEKAQDEVLKLGVNPETVPHYRPDDRP